MGKIWGVFKKPKNIKSYKTLILPIKYMFSRRKLQNKHVFCIKNP